MEEKIFKKQSEFDTFISSLDQNTFYKLLSTEKALFRTINKVMVFDNNDIQEYLALQFRNILSIFNLTDFQEKIYLNENKLYIKVTYEEENSFLLKKYGYVISAIQNLLISYIFSKFSKWYQISINVNNHLHNQKYFLKKQVYFAIKNIKETGKPFHFKPMPNDQRKMIHSLVKDIDGYSSFSQGTGFLRHIVIKAEDNKLA